MKNHPKDKLQDILHHFMDYIFLVGLPKNGDKFLRFLDTHGRLYL